MSTLTCSQALVLRFDADLSSHPRMPVKRHLTLAERLDVYVDRSGGWYACWPFTGPAATRSGQHRQMSWQGRMRLAHRLAYEVAYGEIPPGLVVRHSCDNPPCCNPNHLLLGSQLDNMQDMVRRKRKKIILRGEASHTAKLTEEAVREIRRRVGAGETRTVLARELGVAIGTVGNAFAGRTWSHVA